MTVSSVRPRLWRRHGSGLRGVYLLATKQAFTTVSETVRGRVLLIGPAGAPARRTLPDLEDTVTVDVTIPAGATASWTALCLLYRPLKFLVPRVVSLSLFLLDGRSQKGLHKPHPDCFLAHTRRRLGCRRHRRRCRLLKVGGILFGWLGHLRRERSFFFARWRLDHDRWRRQLLGLGHRRWRCRRFGRRTPPHRQKTENCRSPNGCRDVATAKRTASSGLIHRKVP